ncbi:DNA replication factor Cdt1 isoform X2 [Cyclopterus lumpus]|uniref:DNA replication factor Cdt1 isoform X2 n=1 Tax=Cyclopterus lumpus TaxID=8103 RepID=UPI00148614F6|nr:DNA replication factor Cdt1 isoform X2 [Cyclopterus lumpus]
MAQPRVTEFFAQRKKGVAGPVKPTKQRRSAALGTDVPSTRSRSSKNKGGFLLSSSVHEEFVRVIAEAVEPDHGVGSSDANSPTSSPRTPKRTSAGSEFDLGAAVFSATADHSTAKKRRQEEVFPDASVPVPEKAARTKARKKLVLPQNTPKAAAKPRSAEVDQQHPGPAAKPRSAEVVQQHPGPAAPVSGPNAENQLHFQTSSSPQREVHSEVLSKEGIASLKSRLQRIKELSRASSPASASAPPVGSATPKPTPFVPKAADAAALKFTVEQIKELGAKAQRRKEEREAKESQLSEAHTQDSTEQPAYQRYHNLAQAAPPGLSLPFQYKVLADMFRSMDTVVAMLHNRSETATFAKIKRGVQDMMHKRFEESHLGQIKTVFPEAYAFRQEKNVPTFNSSIKKGRCQLTVEPVLLSGQNEARPVLSASRLLERRNTFHLNLVSIVKQHHKSFLSLLVPPASVPEDKLTRWHPRFNVDTVPAVFASLLPQPPHANTLTTAQEVLDKARSLITPKMEKALVSLAQKTEGKEPACPQNPAAAHVSAPPTALKGVSQSLLDRIRAKEAQKLHAAMTRNPMQEDRLLMMSRLPELARILRNVFVAEKKPALIMEVACKKAVASYRSVLSTGEMEKHIRLLAEVAADWLAIHPIRKDFYLKLNKNMELNVVLDKLSSRLRQEERI